MADMSKQLLSVIEYVCDRLSEIERGTVVVVRGRDLCNNLRVGPLAVARGLRASGFWLCEDGLWRSVAGPEPVNLLEE
ncbi:hypothetical protein SAMN04488042_101734 [Shimia aestuarii]|uniref:Uncharacterized protein n=1 Tax=Shimia aestuarii TaxID=254406 RepID=A0A1I4ISZ5_9RHOB|nr:hypothetical protein SAMN04488042_101734 [Shimia aestuarii]